MTNRSDGPLWLVCSHLFDVHMVSCVSLILISPILPISSPIHKREPHTLPDKESWPNRPVMICQNTPVSPLIESEHGSSPHPIGVPFVSYIYCTSLALLSLESLKHNMLFFAEIIVGHIRGYNDNPCQEL